MVLLFCQKALSISFIVCTKKNLSAVHLKETSFIDSTLVVGGLLSECVLVTSSSIGMMVDQASRRQYLESQSSTTNQFEKEIKW